MRIMITLLTIFYTTSCLKADEILELGKQIFYNEQACINCHILNSDDGGQNKLSKEHVVNIVTNGYGVMPAYKNAFNPFVVFPRFSHAQKLNGLRN